MKTCRGFLFCQNAQVIHNYLQRESSSNMPNMKVDFQQRNPYKGKGTTTGWASDGNLKKKNHIYIFATGGNQKAKKRKVCQEKQFTP